MCRSKYGLLSGFSSSTFFRAKSLIFHVSQPRPKQYQQCNSKFVVRADAVSTHHDLLAYIYLQKISSRYESAVVLTIIKNRKTEGMAFKSWFSAGLLLCPWSWEECRQGRDKKL